MSLSDVPEAVVLAFIVPCLSATEHWNLRLTCKLFAESFFTRRYGRLTEQESIEFVELAKAGHIFPKPIEFLQFPFLMKFSAHEISEAMIRFQRLCGLSTFSLELAMAARRGLRRLELSGGDIRDISAIEKLGSTLEELDLSGCQQIDWNTTATLENLTWVNLHFCGLVSISMLEGFCPAVLSLNLSYNRNIDLSSLPLLSQLRELNLADCRVTKLYPLAKLGSSLEKLNLARNIDLDLTTLPATLPRLQELKLASCALEDITPLGILRTSLKVLDLENNPINTARTPVLDRLVSLKLRNCRLVDASGLFRMGASLEILDLSVNRGLDLRTLTGMGRLKVLDLTLCGLLDASPLVSFSDTLEVLDLSFNGRKSIFNFDMLDIETLPQLDRLKELKLMYCDLVDVFPLTKYRKTLKKLNLSNNSGGLLSFSGDIDLRKVERLDPFFKRTLVRD